MLQFAVEFCVPACVLLILTCAYAYAEPRDTVITILHTNDLHGCVVPDKAGQGLARIATLVKQVRAQMPNVLLFDCGDFFLDTPQGYLTGGNATLSAMNAMGYNALAVGNHEFCLGLPVVDNLTSASKFPFLAANLRAADGSQWGKIGEYSIFDMDGVRVAALGLTTSEVITNHWPNSVKEIKVEDAIETARRLVPQIRQQADVVVVLSHLGDKLDTELAKAVPGIDFILGAHLHHAIKKWLWVGDTLVAQTGAYGAAMGRVDFVVRSGEGPAQIVSVNGKDGLWNDKSNPPLGKVYPKSELVYAGRFTPLDEDVAKAYKDATMSVDVELAQVIGQARKGIKGGFIFSGESPAADLLADALKEYTKADLAVVDSKALMWKRITRGEVTVRSAFEMLNGYTRQELVVARMTGAQLEQALVGMLESRHARIALSGASLEYKADNAPVVVRSFKIAGAALDPQASYTVAATTKTIMDLMYHTRNIQIIDEPKATAREALVEYIKTMQTIQPPPGNRITRVD